MREHDEHEKLRCHPLVPRYLHVGPRTFLSTSSLSKSLSRNQAPSSLLFTSHPKFVQFYVSTHVGSERTLHLQVKLFDCKCLCFLTNMIISVPSEKRSKSCVSKRGGRAARH